MRKLMILSALALLFITACGQKDVAENEIPSVVLNGLKSKFNNPMKTEWQKLDSNFEVEFEIENTEHKAILDQDGKIIKFKRDISKAELPNPVVKTLEREFADKDFDDFELLNIDGQEYYQVEIDETLKDKNIVFTAEGKTTSDIPVWD